ncbi:Rossmann-fold NAD(P)-binding domain-containing protein [Muricoccus vinaceus]|uniref:Uncharacterized protein n=1 Tax=Muricoccus vinaceus TaxID=424704 RepID=A0ABV6IQC9_9PROT
MLYTSHMGSRDDALFAPASDHAATEAFLAQAGLPFTSLRHGFYAESALHLIGRGIEAGEIHAPEVFTMAELATIASELTGREVKRVTVSDDEWLDATLAQGVPAPRAEMLLGMYRAARRGDFATTDPTLEKLLGRRSQTMRDVLASVLKAAAA